MFNRRTLFVLGAGASCEYRLPLGSDLAIKIAAALNFTIDPRTNIVSGGDTLLRENLEREATRLHQFDGPAKTRFQIEHGEAARHIHDAIVLHNSIDEFLEKNEKDAAIQLCGKLAIVRSILDAESSSTLQLSGQQRTIDFPSLKPTWLAKFFALLQRGVSDPRDLFLNVAFINFNYDRCLEHFLYQAIVRSYRSTNPHDAALIVANAPIYHPYGTVGDLPFSISASAVPFGGGDRPGLIDLANSIKTYNEQVSAGDLIQKIHEEVNRAERIVFLGFGYHEPNMKILTPSEKPKGPKQIIATGIGIKSENDRRVVEGDLMKLYSLRFATDHIRPELRIDLDCAGLFDAYWRTMTHSGLTSLFD